MRRSSLCDGVTSVYENRSFLIIVACGLISQAGLAQSGVVIGPAPAAPKAPLSSSFAGPLWDVVAPNGGRASVSNEHLYLNLPGGSNHDTLLPSNQSLRVVQPIGTRILTSRSKSIPRLWPPMKVPVVG